MMDGGATLPAAGLLEKWRGLDGARRALLVEALLCLVASSVALAVLPFRRLVHLPAATPLGRRGGAPVSQIVTDVRWAVTAGAERLPWSALCFHRSLAAQMLLRRRGIFSVLHYGARPGPEAQLQAHVWVTSGDLDVVGCEIAGEFPTLASFTRCETP